MQLEIQYQKSFYNTIHLTGEPLADAETHCRNQEERILFLFRTYNIPMAPSEVFNKWQLVWPVVPITSIRRAMTNLTKRGELRRAERLKTGLYGYLEHDWEINK